MGLEWGPGSMGQAAHRQEAQVMQEEVAANLWTEQNKTKITEKRDPASQMEGEIGLGER